MKIFMVCRNLIMDSGHLLMAAGSLLFKVNEELVVNKLNKTDHKVLAHEDVVELKKPAMGNDNLFYFLEKVPGNHLP